MASRHRKLSEDEAEVFEVNLSTTPEPMEGEFAARHGDTPQTKLCSSELTAPT